MVTILLVFLMGITVPVLAARRCLVRALAVSWGRNEVVQRGRKYTGRSLEGQGTDRVFWKAGGFCRMAVFHGRSRRCSSAADRRSQLRGVLLLRRCTEVVYDSVLRWEPPERLANLAGQAERSVFTGPWTGLKLIKSLKNQTDWFPGGLHWGLQAFVYLATWGGLINKDNDFYRRAEKGHSRRRAVKLSQVERLQSAIRIARSTLQVEESELAEEDRRVQSRKDVDLSVPPPPPPTLHSSSFRTPGELGIGRFRSNKPLFPGRPAKRSVRSFRCGQLGHIARFCRQQDPKAYRQ